MVIEDCDVKLLKKIIFETETAFLELTDNQIKDSFYEEASDMLLFVNKIKNFRQKYFPEMKNPQL